MVRHAVLDSNSNYRLFGRGSKPNCSRNITRSSKYFYDFDLYANPTEYASNRQVYWGLIRYEKRFLWLVPLMHTITNVEHYAPLGYLPYDTYSGGSFDASSILENSPFPNLIPQHFFDNPVYGFIPVVSALDIKRNNGTVNPSDYQEKYAGGTLPDPELTSGFNNFIVDFQSGNVRNYDHISFQPSKRNWLADELDDNPLPLTNCSYICSGDTNSSIIGPTAMCGTAVYSFVSDQIQFLGLYNLQVRVQLL